MPNYRALPHEIIGMQGIVRMQEIIEQTFNVFCGAQQTMDEVGFAKFCESGWAHLAERFPQTAWSSRVF